MNWKKLSVLLIFILLFTVFIGCNSDDVLDQIASYADEDNKNVLSIKNAVPSGHIKTFGEAFEEFFASPTWKYFDADTGEAVVEFTGYCTYMDNEVKAKIQFILDKNNGMYQIGAVALNNIPQNELMKQSLLSKAFE